MRAGGEANYKERAMGAVFFYWYALYLVFSIVVIK
jgi:hypothetical protein